MIDRGLNHRVWKDSAIDWVVIDDPYQHAISDLNRVSRYAVALRLDLVQQKARMARMQNLLKERDKL